MQLTEKEKMLLKDLTASEKLCIEKYEKGSNCAKSSTLKSLFKEIAAAEQTHLDTLNTINQGSMPNMSSAGISKPQAPTSASSYQSESDRLEDQYLCSDALSTEKHVSGVYDTCIFEFAQPPLRNVLNHIQKEEQEHGEMLYKYMSLNNMYN